MITWMQRHKKYLIVLIWVSVISFVGAGFVGWGAYDFNLGRASSVAKVGNQHISIQLFQTTYSNYYNQYNAAVYNGELTEEIAQQIGLDDAVLEALIDEAVLLNFAEEMGIIALDSDVIDFITHDQNFFTNGTFNKDLYYTVLQNAGIKPNNYEETMKRHVVLNKLNDIVFNIPLTDSEKELFGSVMFMQDRLNLATITVEDRDVKISDNETRAYWEANKNNFLSEKVWSFESVFVEPSTADLNESDIKAKWEETKYLYKNSEDKLLEYEAAKDQVEAALRLENAKTDSLKTYLAFKKGEIEAQKNISVKESSDDYDISAFAMMNVGDYLTPVQKENGYEILKLTNVTLPAPKIYEDAKIEIVNIVKETKKAQMLAERAEARLQLFQGTDFGFIGIDTTELKGLTQEQSARVIGTVFNSQNKRGFVIVGDTAFLYDIADQRLPDASKLAENDELITQNARQIKTAEIRTRLINLLKPRYKIEQYYKG